MFAVSFGPACFTVLISDIARMITYTFVLLPFVFFFSAVPLAMVV